MSPNTDRHLSPDSFARYLHTNVPIEHPIPGAPGVTLFIDPDGHRVGLRGPAGEHTPSTGLENLVARRVLRDGRRLIEVAVMEPSLFGDAYPLLCAIADRVQLYGQSMADALAETLRRFGHLLRPEGTLSLEAEAGLLGELCLLDGLSTVLPLADVLNSWMGPQAAEHDFAVAGYDIEVKVTTSELRRHWISSLTQLVPSPARPLWLVSVQVTDAGSGGVRLSDVIERIRGLSGTGSLRTQFEESLLRAGWRDHLATEAARRWALRTSPLAYAVAGDFPRLSPDLLASAGVDGARVPQVRYQIDLTAMASPPAPEALARALSAVTLESA